MSVVLDCSITLAWLLPDEQSEPARQVLDRVVASRAWVPALWWLEIANNLQTALRRGRIDKDFRDASLTDLAQLSIQTDPDTYRFAWNDTLALAETHGLTVYDAAYLELAQRLSLPLATCDGDLREAAVACHVPLLGH